MLVLNLEDGSPYVFPSKIEMDAQISTMKGNTKQADVGSVIQDLQKIAASEGSAEKLRLNWLKKVIKLRLKVITSTPSLSVAGSRVTAANKAEAPIGEFIQKNINSPALPHVDLSALGFQSFSTSRINSNSARASYDWYSYLDSRAKFWNRELELAGKWIDARLAFLRDNLGVA